ncbi:MAG: TetR/AcrR family transcriptional regulator [Pikeienuella sp.]|uniref:TetR/AcrR family transcriptional regulator n=1 Tax=Pikeienuella sp. TaxID=2831957 RepID=UPI0039197258
MSRSFRARPRTPTAKDRQSEETRARLLAAARRLFAEHGYRNVSVTEIAREAGVTHGMIHAHFTAKAGLLYALISESNAEQTALAHRAAAAPGDPWARLRAALMVYAEADARDAELLAVMQAWSWEWPEETEADNKEQLERALAPVEAILREGAASGVFAPDLDTKAATRAIFAIYTDALRAAVFDGSGAADCVEAVMAGIGALAGLRDSSTGAP